jgi:hypothetical protein
MSETAAPALVETHEAGQAARESSALSATNATRHQLGYEALLGFGRLCDDPVSYSLNSRVYPPN